MKHTRPSGAFRLLGIAKSGATEDALANAAVPMRIDDPLALPPTLLGRTNVAVGFPLLS